MQDFDYVAGSFRCQSHREKCVAKLREKQLGGRAKERQSLYFMALAHPYSFRFSLPYFRQCRGGERVEASIWTADQLVFGTVPAKGGDQAPCSLCYSVWSTDDGQSLIGNTQITFHEPRQFRCQSWRLILGIVEPSQSNGDSFSHLLHLPAHVRCFGRCGLTTQSLPSFAVSFVTSDQQPMGTEGSILP